MRKFVNKLNETYWVTKEFELKIMEREGYSEVIEEPIVETVEKVEEEIVEPVEEIIEIPVEEIVEEVPLEKPKKKTEK